MRDPQRIDEMLLDLAAVWQKSPDLRLGQLLVNLVRPSEPCPQIFSIEDAELHKNIRRALAGPPIGE
ncbi:MAG: hypothetical protein AB7V46_00365 [Thermomicrobiales bacterium]